MKLSSNILTLFCCFFCSLKVEFNGHLDDNPINVFHEFLLSDRPTIGVVRFRRPEQGVRIVSAVCTFDALLNAFSRRAADYLLPYDDSLDVYSIFLSQAVLDWSACALFPGQVHRLGAVRAFNEQHRKYKRWTPHLKLGGIYGHATEGKA